MRKILLVLLAVVILIAGVLFVIYESKVIHTSNGISGIFDINGVVPEGSTIFLASRLANTNSQFSVFAQNIQPTDESSWSFSNAEMGKSYEIQALLMQNGKEIATSPIHFTTAPATAEILTINVSSQEAEASQQTSGNATISGKVRLDGYIPDGATITIEGRSLGKQTYTDVAKDLPAKNNQLITYTTAVPGRTYEVRGLLFDKSGKQIGESDLIQIVAPAGDEILTINSSAQPPITPFPTVITTSQPTPSQPSSVITGIIKFNGAANSDSRIVIFQRPSGNGNYQVAVDNIQPVDGTPWQWSGAQQGTLYDMIAVLKQKQTDQTDKDISTTDKQTIAAPAAAITFTINSGFTLQAPNGKISVTCGNYDGGSNSWSVAVAFDSITNATTYWSEIGTTDGGIELANNTPNATSNPTQSYNFTLQNGTTYYARYAYANVKNIHAGDSQFSPFSASTQLRCNK